MNSKIFVKYGQT